MEGSDFLLTIAEVALAIITFAAVVLVLRQLVGGELTAFHLLILKMFALCGFEVLFFALLPFLLAFLGLSVEVLWRTASAGLAIAILATYLWYFLQRRIVAPDRGKNFATVTLAIVHTLVLPLLILHALGLVFVGMIGPYAVGLVSGLFPVAIAFFAALEQFLSVRP